MLTALLTARAAVAAAAVAATVGGAALAAFAGALPTPIQKLAHQIIGAPAARPSATGSPSAGPSPSGLTAYGLCLAYQRAQEHGTGAQRAAAVRNAARAAGGRDKVAGFCARLLDSGAPHATAKATPHPGGKHSSHPGGKPSPHPSHPSHPAHPQPTPHHPTGKPSSHPGGGPSTHPSHRNPAGKTAATVRARPHGTGKPAWLPAHHTHRTGHAAHHP